MTFDIYELINRIRPRPALYLGSTSLTRLDSFLHGYICALDDHGIDIGGTPPFYEFHDWGALKLGRYESTPGWCRMLLEAADGSEQEAFEKFFIYLDGFRERQAKVVLQAVPDSRKEWRYEIDQDTGEKRPLERPAAVQIVKYTDDKGVFIRYVGKDGELVYLKEYCQDLEVAFFRTESLIERRAWERP